MEQLIQILFLALLQGVTELFPVSSLGHTVILPALFGWGNLITAESFLPIVVTLHLGTGVALLAFFWRDWLTLLRALFKTIAGRSLEADPQGKTIWLVIVGTIPVGILGLLLEKPLQQIFFSAPWPFLPAAFLCLNGMILYIGERLRQRAEPAALDRRKQEATFKRLEQLSFGQAVVVGLVQATALLPGISRSGITMVAGLRVGLSHEDAARFAFLLATPVILAAGLLETPKLLHYDRTTQVEALVGGVVAGIAAYLSTRFLVRYFQVGRLTPFAFYCLAAGFISFCFFAPLSLYNVSHLPW
ncbi:MAG TPA: undecaprenyl-diphosphate phosphatase [Ktedonobacterales bacterium]|jgi:undecaprenyl-diphosphatase